ncbi:unnamed protein product [Brachionus calyciflorus]|uniref:Uncharacterized protein n=1 Tax=Brachionus calyciflorus TaxID=104777 RepID=A0A813RS71_9BILA|nr:unnamed protein product [Brachionus calyciflorus]
MSDKYRESPLASTTLVSRNFPYTFTIGNSKTLSVNNTSNVIQANLEKLNINELDNLILSQKSLEFPVSSSNDDEINKARNRRSLVDPLNSSLISRPHHKHRYETILYKELSSLGLKKDRLEKALAATAYTNSIDAINWLMKHSKDPFVNNETITSTRDCLLALCPIGQLQSQISNFFQQVKQKIGCNEAHYNNLLPFMKLTPFFKLPDNQMANLHKAFDRTFKSTINNESFSEPALFTLNKQTKLNEINIDLHISPQMILLYPDIESENTLKQIVGNFSKAAIKYTNYEIIPYSKQLHLTLGYGYDPEHKKVLEEIANRCINYRQQSEWEIRLYSRDSRADAKMTYRVIASNKPKLDNELYIKENDLVYATGSIKDNLMKGYIQLPSKTYIYLGFLK